jgi:hypothetical protein
MSIKNEDVMKMVREKFKGMENHFNVMEKELEKSESDEFNKSKIAISYGKLSKLYEDIAFLMGIYDDNPKYK